MMDLSHSVDDVVQRNLAGLKNVDVIQCSIDAPPLRAVLSRMPFAVIMFYARLMALLRLVPGLGVLLEKSGFV